MVVPAVFLKHVHRRLKEINVVVTSTCYGDSRFSDERQCDVIFLFLVICGSSPNDMVIVSNGISQIVLTL